VRSTIAVFIIFLAASIGVVGSAEANRNYPPKFEGNFREKVFTTPPALDSYSAWLDNNPVRGSVFVGGQNGTWFKQGQFPRLYEITLQSDSYVQLDPVRSSGTVWGGGYNGSQLLVSGWGTDDNSTGPYIWLYNGSHVISEGSLDDYGPASSWYGGDVFAASYNGKEWLLSGLGSGVLSQFSDIAMNHMSLGTFNGSVFTDLSSLVPDQVDAILYANAWNGRYWLVGGGFVDDGVLFTYDGNKTVDLTSAAENAISTFGSVQSLAWNGNYWLIGGIGFLAEYDGRNFTDLTQQLARKLSINDFYSVNAIAWDGQSWLIGGGTPIAQTTRNHAWIASYSSAGFVDRSSALPSYISQKSQSSSILGITPVNGMWILGGYAGAHGILLAYQEGGLLIDYSHLVSGFTYVDWVSSLAPVAFRSEPRYRMCSPTQSILPEMAFGCG